MIDLYSGDSPLYMKIYSYFRKEIINGTFPKGKKLPSKRHLAKEYGIALNTAETAYGKLLEEGFVTSVKRKGYFVSDVGSLYIMDKKKKGEIRKDNRLKYDFSYTGVSEECFPASKLRKAASYVIDESDMLTQVEYQGYLPLREEISAYLKKSRGFEASPQNIVISSGTEYLMQIIFRITDGTYAIENPGYTMLPKILQANGEKFKKISLDEHGMKSLELLKSGCDIAVLTPAHQFPTGRIMSIGRRTEILNLPTIKYIIEDDYDSEFKFQRRPVPALKATDYKDKVIYIGSFSKSISPALRVSYMVLPESLMENYRNLYSCFVCPVSIVIQKILKHFLETGEFEKHLNRMRKIYSGKRQLVTEILKDREDIVISGADAGLSVVLEFKGRMSERDIIEKAEEKSVRIYGMSHYGENSGDVRILLGYATMKDNEIKEGLDIIKEITADNKGNLIKPV